MDRSTLSTPEARPRSQRRANWLDTSIASGFIATVAMTGAMAIAYGLVNAFGDDSGNTLQQWFAALTTNELVDRVGDGFALGLILNLLMGLVWAVVYALWFVQRLPGTGWQRGMLFSLIPWVLSLVVFFPIAGGGLFGSDIDAGFLPALGNLILHLVYGGVLGTLYRSEMGHRAGEESALDLDIDLVPNGSRATTVGIIAGAILGIIGGWLLGPSIENIAAQPIVAFGGLLTGAAMGMTLGMLVGMSGEPQDKVKSQA
jgi:hypothetical protein